MYPIINYQTLKINIMIYGQDPQIFDEADYLKWVKEQENTTVEPSYLFKDMPTKIDRAYMVSGIDIYEYLNFVRLTEKNFKYKKVNSEKWQYSIVTGDQRWFTDEMTALLHINKRLRELLSENEMLIAFTSKSKA